jgi:uncharacterized protein (TIGR02118 family)
MIVLTVCYKSGIDFDTGYYLGKHMPLTAEKLEPLGLQNAEGRKILGTPMETPAPYQIITTLYFNDAASLQSAIGSADGQAVVADIPNFYRGMPDIMIGEVVAGIPR